MNRRKFIASGAMGASLLSIFPSYALTSNSSLTLSNLGQGFKMLSNTSESVSVVSLSEGIKSTYDDLINTVDKLGCICNKNSVVKLNKNSYAVPLLKKSLLGFETKEMALIVEDNYKRKFYILNEKQTNEFDSLICNFSQNMECHTMNIEVSDFSFPVKVIQQKVGAENSFVYKNKFDATITLYSNKSKSRAIIA